MNYEQIIKEIGTPTYVFDTKKVTDRINYLKSKFKGTNIVYAVKANTFITKEIEESVDRFEICSPGEFEICHKLEIDHKKMVISGVYKDRPTIEYMISNFDDIGKYTIESISQWKLLTELVNKYNRKINVLIRITSGNQFGVNEDDFSYIINNNDNEHINIEGIEYFSGTQKHSIKKITREIEYLTELVNRIENETKINIKEIEYGPGLPVFYFQDDEFDEDTFLTEVNDLIRKLPDKVVSLEIGRSIAASCGKYLTRVVDMKTNKNGNFALVDGGIHHLVYYGGTMAMRIPHFEVIYQKPSQEIKTYNLYGSLCTVNDILVKNISINQLNIGDTFIFKNVGAYSYAEGISLFLSRDLPKVVIFDKDKNLKVVRDTTKTSTINFPNY